MILVAALAFLIIVLIPGVLWFMAIHANLKAAKKCPECGDHDI